MLQESEIVDEESYGPISIKKLEVLIIFDNINDSYME